MVTTTRAASAAPTGDSTTLVIPRGAVIVSALFRIGLGLTYLWAFISQGFGLGFTNAQAGSYGWFFSFDASKGWISSGFQHSPTSGFIGGLHGLASPVLQALPTGLVDFCWMFALAGLGIGLTLGICMRIAAWGGFILNVVIWLGGLPPATNPLIDAEHMAFAFGLLLMMYLQADRYWGLGNWWRANTPNWLH